MSPLYGLAGATFPEKIEGLAFGPDLPNGNHLLLVTQDNDFVAGQPSQIFAFAIGPTALPEWQPQKATFSTACVTPSPVTCPSSDACRHDGMCNPGTASCVPPPLPEGTASGTQVAGDCLRNQCDGKGNLVSVADNADVPTDDGNQCTTDVCSSGSPAHPATPAGTLCNQSGGSKCDGQGACVACLAASDCPGVDTDCQKRACTAGFCGVENVAAGTAVATQIAGDCHQNQCDGSGNTAPVVDDTDLPVDGNPCTEDVCSAGVAANPASPSGISCGNGNICNGSGACVGCVVASDCPGVDTECAARSCNANICGMTFALAGTVVTAQVAGDCRSNRCDGAGNVASVADDTDAPTNAPACTIQACAGGVVTSTTAPAFTKCSDKSGGNTCDAAGKCLSAFMLVRIGDGVAPLSNASAPVFVDELTTGGTLLRTIALPTAAVAPQHRFTNSGSASSEGALALSADGHSITLAGYDSALAVTGIASTAASVSPRVVARIDAGGQIDTSLTLGNAFDRNNVRGAVTDDGSHVWVCGANGGATGGVQVLTIGTEVTQRALTSNTSNVRTVAIFGPPEKRQLYGSAGSGVFNNVFSIGDGLPTTSAAATALPGMPASGPSPYAFVFADANTLYVADDRNPPSGGVQKWTFNGATWALSATFTGGLAAGVRGLTGYSTDAGFVLIATTAEGTGQHVVTFVDTGSGAPSATNVTTAGTNQAFRGVSLPPF